MHGSKNPQFFKVLLQKKKEECRIVDEMSVLKKTGESNSQEDLMDSSPPENMITTSNGASGDGKASETESNPAKNSDMMGLGPLQGG